MSPITLQCTSRYKCVARINEIHISKARLGIYMEIGRPAARKLAGQRGVAKCLGNCVITLRPWAASINMALAYIAPDPGASQRARDIPGDARDASTLRPCRVVRRVCPRANNIKHADGVASSMCNSRGISACCAASTSCRGNNARNACQK